MDSAEFARWFRGASPYIKTHRDKVFVVYLAAEVVEHEHCTSIVHDLALLHVLGVRLVVVPSLPAEKWISPDSVNDTELKLFVQTVGELRNQFDTMFAMGVPANQLHSRHIPLASGNFLRAKPRGIIQGVDTGFAGEIRSVQIEEIQRLLSNGMVVLIPPLGYSSSGLMYALNANETAQSIAIALGADKLILMSSVGKIGNHSTLSTEALDEVLAEVPLAPAIMARLNCLGNACRNGVVRAHSVSHEIDGSILQELFTADGVGTQISDSTYRSIRRANGEDIGSITELLKPLQKSGLLLKRSLSKLVEEPEHFLVAELDGVITGCVALYEEEEGIIEIGSLAIAPGFQGFNFGRQLLQAAEKEAAKRRASRVYVLTTQAMDWFRDNGYKDMSMNELPRTRLQEYSVLRNSKPLVKSLA